MPTKRLSFSVSESIENSVHDEKFGRIFFVVLNVRFYT